MVSYNTAVMALLRRMGTRKERALSQLPYALLHDLSQSTHSVAAKLAFHWECNQAHSSQDVDYEEDEQCESATDQDQHYNVKKIPLAKQIPCLLLCVQLSPPKLSSPYASILNRFVMFNTLVRGRAPHVNAIFAAILVHLLPRPYTTVPTMNLILAFTTFGSIRIANYDAKTLLRGGYQSSGIPQWILKQNAEVKACVEGLPRWLQALFPTTDNVDLPEIIDEIARRLPPADEALPGDYADVLAACPHSVGHEKSYGATLRAMYENSTNSAVTPQELIFLLGKLVSLSAKHRKRQMNAYVTQKRQLIDFSLPVHCKPLYSDFARAALREALLHLSLLRHTEKIVAARELTMREWNFIIYLVTSFEKAWCSTAYSAMRTAVRIAEQRRRDEVKRSGKAEGEVSLFGSMNTAGRLRVLALYTNGMYTLRFDSDLFYAALECTKPLLQEYFRELQMDTASSLRALDAKFRIRQVLSVVTRADNVNERAISEESENAEDEDEVKPETSRTGGPEMTGEATLSLLGSLERFFAEPIFTSFFPPAASTPSVPAKRRSGFARANLPDCRYGAAGTTEGLPSDELTLCMHVVECAIVHCLHRCRRSENGHDASSELIEFSLRFARRMQRIVEAHLRYIASVIQRSDPYLQAASVDGGAPSDKPTEAVIVEGIKGEIKTLQLTWLIPRLLTELTERKNLSAAERADIADVASAVMRDLVLFMDLISHHRVLPSSLNRNLTIFHKWYTAHKCMLKCSAVAADAPPFQAAEENVRKLVISSLGVVQRVFLSYHHQRARAVATPASSFDLSKYLATIRILDCAVSLALAGNITLAELPQISDLMQRAFDAIREALSVNVPLPPSGEQGYNAQSKLRCAILAKVIHLLHHVCTLSLYNEACLAAAAGALNSCAKEDYIVLQSWKRRNSILSMTSYIYRILSERFAHSRASRDLAHQLLVMTSRLASDLLSYREPVLAALEPPRRLSDGEAEMRQLVSAVLMWHVSCAVAAGCLQTTPVEKYLGIMNTYVKRNLVISLNAPGMEELSTLGAVETLEYCEQLLAEAGPLAGRPHDWRQATTKEAVIVQCNMALRDVFFALRILSRLLYTDATTPNAHAFRLRWIHQTELACRLLMRYQRWIAPSVWRSVWLELVNVMAVMRISHTSSVEVQETADMTLLRLLSFSKIRGNKGAWVKFGVMHVAASEEDDGAVKETVTGEGHAAGALELLPFLDLSRMFELQERLTDIEMRIYLVELTDRLSREGKGAALTVERHGTALEQQRYLSLNGLIETQTERQQRYLRIARTNILFACRRMRS
ncbi:hypothetical protein LSCM4_00592 [Leishmania orientalis]|uniref:Uncharacterized protein n=1 Tax=Leishmania orientalis TaxID=2249476 RepID=A0A836KBW1_9TRYP|nr:hypothetical protein LSCM4_00592 [Leishmania orientalis]